MAKASVSAGRIVHVDGSPGLDRLVQCRAGQDQDMWVVSRKTCRLHDLAARRQAGPAAGRFWLGRTDLRRVGRVGRRHLSGPARQPVRVPGVEKCQRSLDAAKMGAQDSLCGGGIAGGEMGKDAE